jgi:hypothetical protein
LSAALPSEPDIILLTEAQARRGVLAEAVDGAQTRLVSALERDKLEGEALVAVREGRRPHRPRTLRARPPA